MRPLSRTLAAVGTTLLAGTLLASPASARPAVELLPSELDRGADVAVPHLDIDGHTVVDGTIRVASGLNATTCSVQERHTSLALVSLRSSEQPPS